MEVYWTLKAQDDLERIYRFALQYSRQHADDILDRLITGCAGLTAHPAIGQKSIRLFRLKIWKLVLELLVNLLGKIIRMHFSIV